VVWEWCWWDEAEDVCAQRISHCLAGGLAAVDCFDR
jgi:hypothetical protein